jgi:N-acetylglucosaminyl-diphospho-decaprenol L-rhamnosyltransferase
MFNLCPVPFMDLAIITVSYNTRELLADCLQSTLTGLERSGLTGEVWVFDNASSDGSPGMVRQRFPQARLVAHDENLGFAAGNNRALQIMGFPFDRPSGPQSTSVSLDRPPVPAGSDPRYILFLNPDTRVRGDALGAMVRFLDASPAAGAAGARLVHGDGSFQHSAFAFPGLVQILLDFFPLHHRLLDSRLNGRYPERWYKAGRPFPVDHPLGAALMVRGETLARVGGFDERFFMYCEEIDLCRRIKAAGWQIYCLPEAEIVHLVGQSTRQFRDRMFVALWRSRFLMFDKHNGVAFRWAARRLVRLGLRAEVRRAEAAQRRGEIDAAERHGRLAAYREVAAL